MTAYDGLMGFGLIAVVVFIIKAFWRVDGIDPIEQPDKTYGGPPNDPSLPGGHL